MFEAQHRPKLGVGLIIIAMAAISINDTIIKFLSSDYPLHQMVFIRSSIGICIALALVQVEGGLRILRTRRPGLHALRALMIVAANIVYFAALSVLPIGLATALFFVSPLFISLLSMLVLGERVGPRRLMAILFGLVGVAIVVSSDVALPPGTAPWVLALPMLAAAFYATMQVLTAKLGGESQASAMSVYIHIAFLTTSAVFFLGGGDGRYAQDVENDAILFLVRAWSWPATEDLWMFGISGVMGGIIGYTISQAYRLGPPSFMAPFEYVALPFAMTLGWLVFGEVPGPQVWIGSLLIVGAGVYVFWREGREGPPVRGAGVRR